MLRIDTTVAQPLTPRQAPLQETQRPVAEHESVGSRSQALRKTELQQAFDINDDLSALRSSLRRTRSAEGDGTEARDVAWMDHVLEPKGPEKVAALRQQLQQMASRDQAAIRALLVALFPDPSDAVAVLRVLLAEDELEVMRETLASLHDELLDPPGLPGRQVRAGLNVALKARLHAPQLKATPAQLRHSYREFLGEGAPVDSYETWIGLYGFERRGRVVEFIERALAADMYALDPSCSMREFGALLQRVRQLTTLRSADHLLFLCCWQADIFKRVGLDQPAFLLAVLTMLRRGGGFRSLVDTLFVEARYTLASEDKARLLQGIRRFLKAMPHALWADIGAQTAVLGDMDALLDQSMRHERGTAGDRRWVAV
ncbi:type III secretion system gatekeeper subunit SctW [Xanthomonas sp. 60]